MKRKGGEIVLAVICVVFVIFSSFDIVQAETGASVKVSVNSVITGEKPSSASDNIYILQALDPINPMPQGSVDDKMEIKAPAEGTASFGTIYFPGVGEYYYRISQKTGTQKNCQYDSSVYTLKIAVLNKDSLYEQEAYMIIGKDGQQGKWENMVFTNNYQSRKENTQSDTKPVKTGDTTGYDFYLAALLISSGFLMACSVKRRKSNSSDHNRKSVVLK